MRKCMLLFPLAMIAAVFLFAGKSEGKSPRLKISIPPAAAEEKLIPVPALCQFPTLPTGCETAAAVMVLAYYGESVDMETFAASWLAKDNGFYQKNGQLYGPDPHQVFVGDPFSKSGYGCYARPLAAAINANSPSCMAEVLQGKTLADLCSSYIDENRPVLLWVTSQMQPAKAGKCWQLHTGETFTWISGEHCMVLCGYDQSCCYLNDPQTGSLVSYEKTAVISAYEALGRQAVVLTKY